MARYCSIAATKHTIAVVTKKVGDSAILRGFQGLVFIRRADAATPSTVQLQLQLDRDGFVGWSKLVNG